MKVSFGHELIPRYNFCKSSYKDFKYSKFNAYALSNKRLFLLFEILLRLFNIYLIFCFLYDNLFLKKILDIAIFLYTIYAFTIISTFFIVFYPIVFLIRFLKDEIRTPIFFFITRWGMEFFLICTFIRVHITGRKYFKRRKKYIVIANHRSFLDIILMNPYLPRYHKIIAKIEFMKVPVLNAYYKLGTVLINRKSRNSKMQSFDVMKEVLQKKYCMGIFPEGTRNRTDATFLPFKDGAFTLALQTGVSIIPAVIVNSDKVIPANKKFCFKLHKVGVHFLPEVKPQNFADKELLKQHCFDLMKKEYIKRKFKHTTYD